jgi:hypothetical protein
MMSVDGYFVKCLSRLQGSCSAAPEARVCDYGPLRESDRQKTGTTCSSDLKRLYARGFR